MEEIRVQVWVSKGMHEWMDMQEWMNEAIQLADQELAKAKQANDQKQANWMINWMIQLDEILELMEWLVGHLINEQRVAWLLLQSSPKAVGSSLINL